MIPVLAFDIETVPDIDGLRLLHGLGSDVPDAQVANMAFQRRRQQTGSDFLPLHLHRVVVISCALRDRDSFRVWSLGGAGESEAELVRRFFDGIDKYTPQLVSWNGGGFDLPVLHYRGLIHGIQAARYWDLGDDDRDFKWNNYISRYHTRHLDLMDLLALYQPRANVALDELAQLMGLPGKLGMEGGAVWDAYRRGELEAVRCYCEADVVNTYLVFLRFQLMRGVLNREQYRAECALVRATLERIGEPHWAEFLQRWKPER
ncbi:3'-5' exonuclease [Pelomicrobium methylotrophicum]|uniref:3'-5' exonuclease n=1 Tax=Pelomicrobium methylotrophicum TaxID=2602750 RepID=A0A5C7EZH0_9PROT|nr:3'-5' exonuclease [Pelomicrobium methylotrophicum]TXF12498.1 3'-5' exonuclease [Pelomicrobium methylotrophicum]